MFINTFDLTRWNRISVGIGGAVWMVIVLARLFSWIVLDDLVLILLLALCVITPLAVPLVALPKKPRLSGGLSGLAIFLQPFVTLIGGPLCCLTGGRSPPPPLAYGSCSLH